MQKTMELNRLQRGHLFTLWELKLEGRVPPYLTPARNVCIQWLKFPTALHMQMSTSDQEGAVSIEFGVLNIDQQVGELTHTESVNEEDQLYMLPAVSHTSHFHPYFIDQSKS